MCIGRDELNDSLSAQHELAVSFAGFVRGLREDAPATVWKSLRWNF